MIIVEFLLKRKEVEKIECGMGRKNAETNYNPSHFLTGLFHFIHPRGQMVQS
jgi:hypothetical protein